MKNTLILVGGYPGTGKTYLSKKIVEKINCVYLDKDSLQDVFTTKRRTQEAKELKNIIYPLIYKITDDNLALNNNVLIDAPFNLRSYMQNQDFVALINSLIKKNKSKIKVIWCIVDTKIRAARIKKRSKDRDKEIFPFFDDFLDSDKYIPTSDNFPIPFNHLIFDTEKDTLEKIWDFLED